MVETEKLLKQYFLQPQEEDNLSAPVIFANSLVTPLVQPQDYFKALASALGQIEPGSASSEAEQPFIYILEWAIDLEDRLGPVLIPCSGGSRRLDEILIEKARAGVDVRLLTWVSWALGLAGRFDLRYENLINIQSVQALRSEPSLANKCCLNVVGHPAGGVHTKMVIMGKHGWATAFTGGVDLVADRLSPNWLDVHAQVQGPAVQPLYDLFRDIWNQNLDYDQQTRSGRNGSNGVARPVIFKHDNQPIESVVPGTPPTPSRQVASASHGAHYVQSLRTVPRFLFAPSPVRGMVGVSPIHFAPDGVFEYREALKKAIGAAERYIYAEDQYFFSVEIMSWIRQALIDHPGLKVILLTAEKDPPGPPLPKQMPVAILDGLLPGLTPEQVQRIAVYKRSGIVHAKTTVIDDSWAVIGSANYARRSLYTDVEHVLAFMDPAGSLVRDYRVNLWRRHFPSPAVPFADLLNLDTALGLWDHEWGQARSPNGLAQPDHLFRMTLDPPPDRPTIDQEWYDIIEDPDSRQPWYLPVRAMIGMK